jgi:NADH:ubiquinone oxidoreductase subunit K
MKFVIVDLVVPLVPLAASIVCYVVVAHYQLTWADARDKLLWSPELGFFALVLNAMNVAVLFDIYLLKKSVVNWIIGLCFICAVAAAVSISTLGTYYSSTAKHEAARARQAKTAGDLLQSEDKALHFPEGGAPGISVRHWPQGDTKRTTTVVIVAAGDPWEEDEFKLFLTMFQIVAAVGTVVLAICIRLWHRWVSADAAEVNESARREAETERARLASEQSAELNKEKAQRISAVEAASGLEQKIRELQNSIARPPLGHGKKGLGKRGKAQKKAEIPPGVKPPDGDPHS